MNLNKISRIILIVLFAVSVAIGLYFIFGSNGISAINAQFDTNGVGADKVQSSSLDVFLNWASILFYITVAVTLLFVVVQFVGNLMSSPKAAIKSLMGIGLIIIVFLIARGLADSHILKIGGYNGGDDTEGWMIASGTLLYGVYILSGIAVVSMIGTGLWKLFK